MKVFHQWCSVCVVLFVCVFGFTRTGYSQIIDCNDNGFADVLEVDTDGDDIIDDCDNCTENYNENQRDTDDDGFGNLCDPDVNNDGVVGIPDLNIFSTCFGVLERERNYNPDCDFHGNGAVDGLALSTLAAFFGGAPGPARAEVKEGIRPDERADLVAEALRIEPTYPVPGETIEVDIDISNIGRDGATTADVEVFAGTTQIGADRVTIQKGETVTLKFSWLNPPEGVQGVVVLVDPQQELVERNRTDNTLTADLIIAPQPPAEADLAVSALEVLNLPDRAFVPRVTIRNNGSGMAQVPLVFRAKGEVIATKLLEPLGPSESITLELPWPPDEPLADFSVEVNPRFADLESNEIDNIRGLDLRDPVDLAIQRLSVHAVTFEAGYPHQQTVSFRVTNVGTTPVTEPFVTRISLGLVDTLRVDIDTPPLAPGQSAYVSRTFDIQQSRFSVSAKADATDMFLEQNRVNNLATTFYENPNPQAGRWLSIGPREIASGLGATGRLMTIAVDPTNGSIIYVGSPSGSGGQQGGCGLWKTTDGGSTWQPIGDSLPSLAISALAIDPSKPTRVYAATQDQGMFRTEDGGTTWVQVTTTALRPLGNAGNRLLVDPTNPDRLHLSSRDGIYRSTDRGVTWQLVLNTGTASSLVMDPSDANHLYAAMTNNSDLSQTGIYESFDSGATWTDTPLSGCPGDALPNAVTQRTTIRIAISGGRLYAGYLTRPPDQSCSYTVYRTTDIGCSIGGRLERQWEKGWETSDPGICKTLWSGLYADPSNPAFLYVTGTRFYVSRNGGDSFKIEPGPQPHVDHHAFAVDSSDSKIIYTVCDGGIYRSTNRGEKDTWKFLGEGLTIVEFYDIADARTEPDLVIGGTQDNGTIKYTGNSSIWGHIRGGDGGTCDIDPTNADVMYSMNQYGDSIRRSTNGGGSFPDNFGLPIHASTCFNLHYQVHPGTQSIVLASCSFSGTGGLWRKSGESAWSTIWTPPTNGIRRSAVDPSVDLYYAGAGDGRLYAGPGGGSWRLIFRHPANRAIRDIEVDQDDPSTIYVCFSGSNTQRVYRIRRTSASPTEGSTASDDITSDLPTGLTVRTVGIDRRNDLTIYAGTTRGVYRGRSVDGGATWSWTLYNSGLPAAVDVNDLEVHPTTGVIRASTLGRGAYEVNTAPPLGSILAIEGMITFLRVHDVGTGFGPPGDRIDGEAIVKLDSDPDKAFGFPLRADRGEEANVGMFKVLRESFRKDRPVRIEYEVTGIRNNQIIRVIGLPSMNNSGKGDNP